MNRLPVRGAQGGADVEKGPGTHGDWHPVQVLAPMRRGTAGVESMNQQLQALLNPGREEVPEISRHANARVGSPVFRLGDRVVQTINNYEHEVFNGDPGFVVDVNPKERRVKVEFAQTDYFAIKNGTSPQRVCNKLVLVPKQTKARGQQEEKGTIPLGRIAG